MLEWLFFTIGGYNEGYMALTVCDRDGHFVLDYYPRVRGFFVGTRPCHHAVWTKEQSRRWLTRFEELHCENWREEYCDPDIMDGTQWTLRYKYEGQRERQISGSNAFPDNWLSFRNTVVDAARRLPKAEDVTVDELLDTLRRKKREKEFKCVI